ncbi:MAG: hypothetical protein ACR2G5_15560, partial [Pyrinomonadaceae bacterium]
ASFAPLSFMRQRVFTKNPVRENRTPGSVRGLSGNWQSYRDLRGLKNFARQRSLCRSKSGQSKGTRIGSDSSGVPVKLAQPQP